MHETDNHQIKLLVSKVGAERITNMGIDYHLCFLGKRNSFRNSQIRDIY